MRRVLHVVLIGWLLSSQLSAGEPASQTPKDAPPERKVADFSLKDYRGKSHALSDYAGHKLVVVAVLGTECPLAKLYGPRLADLAKTYEKQGVAFLGLNANRQDSITEIAAYARVHGIEFPILKDLGNAVADRLGAERTPEVFVLDADRVIRYRGRIDDQYGIGYVRDEPTRRDLALALDQLLAGKNVETAETKAIGCLIGRAREPDDASAVTYSNQIARILQDRCVECHRAGQIAPFELTSYDEVAGWADMIAEVVREERMPPWHASPSHGEFSNARRLTDEEKQQIFAWVKAGAPEGDPQDLPEPRAYVEGWQMPRTPELVVKMRDEPFDVPAEGAVEYKYFTVDPGFTEDKWVKMAEVRPGNRAVVHHILILVRPPKDREGNGAGGGEFLVGYVPGMRHAPYDEGMAKLIPAGSKLVFQVHYTPNGSPQTDLSEVGFLFADPKEVDHIVVTSMAVQPRLRIPPHEDSYRAEAISPSHSAAVKLLSFSPHMHLRGKSFRYEAVYPDRTREVLLDVPRYDFNWQTAYRLAEPKILPAGTRLHCVAEFDNSEQNLANPDPTATVGWGDQTWNEMMIGYFDIAVPVKNADDVTIRNRPRPAEQLMQRFDKNGDGNLSRDEVPAQVAAVFAQLDSDGDGLLSVDEVREGLSRLRRRD